MPWNALPTNYTDSVWSGKKRYRKIINSDRTVSLLDITNYYVSENSFLRASDLNRIGEAINSMAGQTHGITPILLVQVTSGATVTLSDGTVEMVEIASGDTARFSIPGYGQYTVSASLNGQTSNVETINVNTVKIYTVGLTI